LRTRLETIAQMPDGKPRQKSRAALLLIDVINHFEYPDGNRILRNARAIGPRLAKLKKRAKSGGLPVLYVNDNFGQWRSDAGKLVDYCLRPEAPGRAFVEALQPEKDDYFVLKPMHSAFYQTPLETLLRYLGSSTLVLCGLATNSCIICTAHDANMRDFKLFVPSDCCAARTRGEHQQAIQHIGTMADAKTMPSARLRLDRLFKLD
jgi:nicotinamidase-related amidase